MIFQFLAITNFAIPCRTCCKLRVPHKLWRDLLKPRFQLFLLCFFALIAAGASVAQTTKAQLEVSETIFTMAVALNSCGYDAGLDNSLPLRQTVRTEVQTAIQKSAEAARALQAICHFQREHLPADADRDVPQYISLALDLGEPPAFKPALNEADLPPDAAQVLGVVNLLRNFYELAGLHAIWEKHQAEYLAQVQRFHDPVANVITQTDLYLKLPFSSYLGRRFVVYLEPMLAPPQVNARNYGDNYFLVVSPAREGAEPLRLHEIRHTYLHYVLDPMALKHARSLKRLDSLLESVQGAPLDASYKQDISLLVNEVSAYGLPSLKYILHLRGVFPNWKCRGKAEDPHFDAEAQRSIKETYEFAHKLLKS